MKGAVMGKIKTLKEISNQCCCRRNDVSDPNGYKQPKAKQPAAAADLCECQVIRLLDRATQQRAAGLNPADYCQTMFGFTPTTDDREHIAWVISLHPEWR